MGLTPARDRQRTEATHQGRRAPVRAESPGLLREFAAFAGRTILWWLTPLVMLVVALVVLYVLTRDRGGQFVYTIF